MATAITGERVQTSFDLGLNRFTWLMIQLMVVMVPLVFFINGFTKRDWKGAFFFAMAVAVGLTPEMLPMIVSVCLSKGALAMSRRKVIVKRLNSIQNFGGMDVLCTDKTGTLTEDRVVLMRRCNIAGRETEEVLLKDVLQTWLKRSDTVGPSCDGTGQRCSKDDISKPRSSFCVFDVIFDMRSACVTSKRSWQSGMSRWTTLRFGAGFNVTRRN